MAFEAALHRVDQDLRLAVDFKVDPVTGMIAPQSGNAQGFGDKIDQVDAQSLIRFSNGQAAAIDRDIAAPKNIFLPFIWHGEL